MNKFHHWTALPYTHTSYAIMHVNNQRPYCMCVSAAYLLQQSFSEARVFVWPITDWWVIRRCIVWIIIGRWGRVFRSPPRSNPRNHSGDDDDTVPFGFYVGLGDDVSYIHWVYSAHFLSLPLLDVGFARICVRQWAWCNPWPTILCSSNGQMGRWPTQDVE